MRLLNLQSRSVANMLVPLITKALAIVFFVLALINQSHANNSEKITILAEALEQHAASSADRLPILVELIKQTRRSNPAQAERYAEQGFSILKQIPSNKYQSLIYGYIAKIHLER